MRPLVYSLILVSLGAIAAAYDFEGALSGNREGVQWTVGDWIDIKWDADYVNISLSLWSNIKINESSPDSHYIQSTNLDLYFSKASVEVANQRIRKCAKHWFLPLPSRTHRLHSRQHS